MPTSEFISTQDGLRLHVRSYGSRLAPSPAVICLPGLTRTGADFHALASALADASDAPRHVLTMDSRGRGQSEYDRNWRNYNVIVEASDVLAVLTALGIHRAVIVGTSRGGILAMLLGCARPAAIAGVVLNDIGPVIESRGLARIKSYVGKLPTPRSFEDGAEILRHLFADQFPKLSTEDWIAFSHRTFEERQGRFVPTYDVQLARTLDDLDTTHSLPPLWREFDALAGVPLMLIRGMNSDVLSTGTVSAMLARRPDLELIEVPDQGHTPLLSEPDLIARLCAFVRRCH